ncbi:MAG: hypothetical protein HZA80_03370 [Candidatus Taylorbacteria bacterium]|nr:hypothetical protein [Candidatus Taylorbacteria bacterium]
MDSKKLIWFGMIAGSFIGSIIPMTWGASSLSISSIVFTAIGGCIGIILAFKISH